METTKIPYEGREYDNRIEAQWAVFFHLLGIPFLYREIGIGRERDDYQTVPFVLPEQNLMVFFEYDEPRPEWESLNKSIYIFGSEMQIEEPCRVGFPVPDVCDWPYFWCECPDCGSLGIGPDGHSDFLPCKGSSVPWEYPWYVGRTACPHYYGDGNGDYNTDSPRLIAAYEAAIDFGKTYRERQTTLNVFLKSLAVK